MPFDLFHRSSSYTLTRQDGFTVSVPQALRTKRYVLLFIAGQWWAPCRGVTAQLKTFYDMYHDTHDFDVIFLSTDKSKEAMLDFFHSAHGDWLCLDYKDARNLEAELAREDNLHPKQVPACLVFELNEDILQKSCSDGENGEQDAASELHGTPVNTLSFPPYSFTTASSSFARLITMRGREMLSKDKEGVLFPWYDDGWNDRTAHRRVASLRKSPSTQVPLTSSEPVVDVVAVEGSITKAKHVDVLRYSNPCSPSHRPSSTMATPSTQPVMEHPGKNRSDTNTRNGEENSKKEVASVQDLGMSIDAHREEETTPPSRRQLLYSKSPEPHDTASAKPSPSPAATVERKRSIDTRRVTFKIEPACNEKEEKSDNSPPDADRLVTQEIQISAVMEELLSSEISTDPDEDAEVVTTNAPAENAKITVVTRDVPAAAPCEAVNGKDAGNGKAPVAVDQEEATQPKKGNGWKRFFSL